MQCGLQSFNRQRSTQVPATRQMDFEQLEEKMRSTWMTGDFGQIAQYSAKGAEEFVDRLSILPGMRVLDSLAAR